MPPQRALSALRLGVLVPVSLALHGADDHFSWAPAWCHCRRRRRTSPSNASTLRASCPPRSSTLTECSRVSSRAVSRVLRVAWLHGVSPQASNQSGRLAFAALGIAALPLGSTLGSHSRQRGAARGAQGHAPFCVCVGVRCTWCHCGVGVVHLLGATMPHRALCFQALPLIVLSASRRSHFPGATPLPSMSGPSPFRPATRGAHSLTACVRARVRAVPTAMAIHTRD